MTDIQALNDAYGHLDGTALLDAVIHQAFPGRIAVTSSFGTESAVLLDLVAQVAPNTPVIFLDTGVLFDETIDYKAELERHLGLTNIQVVRPTPEDEAAADKLWKHDPDRCCHLRKVLPLRRATEPFAALIDGRKRHHGDSRAALGIFSAGGQGVVKVSPLAHWDGDRIADAFEQRKLPLHPLLSMGYLSVGCWPCTEPVAEDATNIRAGRWAGAKKTECGIHLADWTEK